MSDFDNNLRGALFKNDKKEKESHPDYRGSCEVEGTEYWISAWIKEGKSGKFMSLSLQPKEAQEKPSKPPKQSKPDYDEDLPF